MPTNSTNIYQAARLGAGLTQEQAALAMALQWRSFEPHVRRFMEIARDGHVDESEEINLEAVQASVADFVATLLSVRCAKKERPDGGTSKRSSSQRTENHCKSIVSGISGDCKRFFAGTEVSA